MERKRALIIIGNTVLLWRWRNEPIVHAGDGAYERREDVMERH